MAKITPLVCDRGAYRPASGSDTLPSQNMPDLDTSIDAGQGITIDRLGTQGVVINAICPGSLHTATLTVDKATGVLGETFCWTLTLDKPVSGSQLTVTVAIDGAPIETAWSGLNFKFNPGDKTAQLCAVTPIAPDSGSSTWGICVDPQSNPRITNDVAPVCATVNRPAAGGSAHTILSVTPVTSSVIEGADACWTVQLDSNVSVADLVIGFTLSGADQARNGYAPPSLTIPIGSSSGIVCVTTTNDAAVDGVEQLCISANPANPRLNSVPAPSCIDVLDNDSNTPTFSNSFAGTQPCHSRGNNHNALAWQGLYINANGTWSVRNGQTGNMGTLRAGSWLLSGSGACEVKFVAVGESTTITMGDVDCTEPSPVTTPINDDSGWLPLTFDQLYQVNAYASANVSCNSQDTSSSADVTVTIREVANPSNSVTGIVTICADASAITG